jgi:hypothetical protein
MENNMRFMKGSAATAAAAMVLASLSVPTVAHAKKYKPHHNGHHHGHHYKHNKYRGVGAAAAATAVIIGSAAYYDCKKWKARYKNTGNPYYLDRYYACKY